MIDIYCYTMNSEQTNETIFTYISLQVLFFLQEKRVVNIGRQLF